MPRPVGNSGTNRFNEGGDRCGFHPECASDRFHMCPAWPASLPGDREVVRRAVALFALPHLAPEGARALWNTADAIWTALGDTSEDYNWYTKRATLSGVYSSTVLFWLGDDSAGHQATWEFLDRRIEDVMQFEKLKAGVEKNPLLKPVFAVPTWLLGRVRRPQRGPGGYPGWTGPRP